jgi:N-methylhydantoinase A/oxoprolinase/acetone carboxylase beta subunit
VTRGGTSIDYQVLRREALGSGASFTGPVIVEERTATTVVGPADSLDVGEFGELVITVAPRRPGAAR